MNEGGSVSLKKFMTTTLAWGSTSLSETYLSHNKSKSCSISLTHMLGNLGMKSKVVFPALFAWHGRPKRNPRNVEVLCHEERRGYKSIGNDACNLHLGLFFRHLYTLVQVLGTRYEEKTKLFYWVWHNWQDEAENGYGSMKENSYQGKIRIAWKKTHQDMNWMKEIWCAHLSCIWGGAWSTSRKRTRPKSWCCRSVMTILWSRGSWGALTRLRGFEVTIPWWEWGREKRKEATRLREV